MKKGAIAVEGIVIMILALIVLGMSLTVFDPLYKYAGEKLKYSFNQTGFQPSKPPPAGDDQKVIDSINGLVCTLNIISSGKVDFSKCPKTETKILECNGKSYGDVCVECSKSDLNFVSLSNIKNVALKELSEYTIACYDKLKTSKKDVSCFEATSKTSQSIDENDFWNSLKNSGKLGEDIAGTYGFLGANTNYEFDISDFKKFYVCGKTGVIKDTVILTNDKNHCPLLKEDLKKPLTPLCIVKNFELPQKIDEASFNPVSWIAGNDDPKHVLYYEAFPFGEEDSWMISIPQISYGMIIATNSISLIPFGKITGTVGSALKKGTDVVSKTVKFGTKYVPGAEKLLKYSKAVSGAGIIAKTGKAGIKLVKWPLSKAGAILKGGYEVVGVVAGKVVYKISPEYYVKMFSDANSLIKYADRTGLEKLLKELGEQVGEKDVFEFLSEKELIDVIDDLMKNPEVAKSVVSFKELLIPFSPGNIKTLLQQSEKHAFGLAAGLLLAKMDSFDEKFMPIGIDSVGLKNAYTNSFVTGEKLPELNNKIKENYVQLVKDKTWSTEVSGFDFLNPFFAGYNSFKNLKLEQDNQRFFLASPCKAHLLVTQTECGCFAPDIDFEAKDFGGGSIPVAKYSLNEENPSKKFDFGIKLCPSTDNPESGVYKTKCVNINPVILNDSFCYSGDHFGAEWAKKALVPANIVSSVSLTAVSTVIKGLGVVGAAETFGISVPVAWVISSGVEVGGGILIDVLFASEQVKLAKETKWPNH